MQTTAFWDNIYATSHYSRSVNPTVVQAALDFAGNLAGKHVLEIGCGPGAYAIAFASHGAYVVGVDISPKAINDLNDFCSEHHIDNVKGICESATELSHVGSVDFVFGSMILHHVEPFDRVAAEIRRVLKPGGKGFFYENSAVSRLLIWFRSHIVGHFGVPKYGDNEEFPLTPQEVDILRKYFKVTIIHPEMFFFELIAHYLTRGRFATFFRALDSFCFRHKLLLDYSYRQYVLIEG